MPAGKDLVEQVEQAVNAARNGLGRHVHAVLKINDTLEYLHRISKSNYVKAQVSDAQRKLDDVETTLIRIDQSLKSSAELVRSARDQDQGRVERLMRTITDDSRHLDGWITRMREWLADAATSVHLAGGASNSAHNAFSGAWSQLVSLSDSLGGVQRNVRNVHRRATSAAA